ncbi:oxygen-independent coproporphyrinogen III oxidase [Leptospira sp. GIMC2001]|uniref:oxygen-independent coproporphyrinogen III oxidase n=1 Tax=Leptospira sp. GIMC2001 TaxID=1513297 RepID=UPI002349F597|nr:oxygen-independent coproporphyrinogen III oxidase [Leptospira sp. GIMC2001]WCL49389.1 oxygen-independent coproporphyrinogen III oxidase [Leptospira sp. GIMC2001]
MTSSVLLQKYDIPAPRYTSYPTVPYWTDSPTSEEWINSLERTLSKSDTKLSIYIHIPFCETLCTFCGCNTSITKNHSVEDPYLSALFLEIDTYLEKLPKLKDTPIVELHLGGGSPTYLSESNLDLLVNKILQSFRITKNSDFSIEVDPRRTTKSQLEVLFRNGFRRISLGVQDFDSEVQRLINRNQSFDQTKKTTDEARLLGYNSINFDLIYGLPKQNLDTMRITLDKTLELRPDRIAFYSYAHVPWIKASQRLFTEADLPQAMEKRNLYEYGRSRLEDAGYKEIGMDHFALETDELWKSYQAGNLHRNFMGYTPQSTDILLGLGTSAISETPDCFHQNEKLEIKYRKIVHEKNIPTLRGHKLNVTDQFHRKLLLSLMTRWQLDVPNEMLQNIKLYLAEMEADGLVEWKANTLYITEMGKPFLRVVCTAFDERLRASKLKEEMFSRAI